MKIGNKNLLLHLIILLLNLCIGGVKLEVVKDEKDLLKIISSNIKILEINVENEINITNNINVNSFEKVIISGGSTENSILNFLNLSHYLHFDNGVKEIQLNSLSIRGNLYFHDNLKINIQNVHLTGNINSKFDIRNEYINISNFKYESSSNESDNCINLRGGNVNINNSTFFGSSSCQNRLINYNGNGDDKYNLIIKDSYFSGEYQCPILDIINGFNIDINNSIFEKAYSSESIEGGSVMHALNSYVYIKNCTLKDNLSSEKGGAFYLYDLYDFEADHLDIFNTTSLKLGSMSYISTSENINSIAKFTNIKQIDTGNILGMTNGGLIMGLEKSSNVLIDNYYAENLINPYETACAFVVSEYATLTMSNIEIDTIQGRGTNGLFVYTCNSYNINISVTNVLINNGKQLSVRQTSIIWISDNCRATFDK
ncbi:hypothetical protein BCR36DRAFT_284080 [Piromyces finnis]|uniref:Right handed beta helix domain-containing protein n=1 Tax=Piromyces finnis TaxID=1754191 RepID=A0A1Y1VEW5_9FUNG|nr:hypothetical protein BCR36DRAFT_284080 [Piromyces finnis]|eukprot:ORX53773.1 hypothetical protein BCR36DRAFT_284080 [Piromyces finnis]